MTDVPDATRTDVLGLDLGPGELPTSAVQWQERLRQALLRLASDHGTEQERLWEQVRITADDGPDGHVAQVSIDVSGARVGDGDPFVIFQGADNPPQVPVQEETTIDLVHVQGDPVHIQGVPFRARAQLQNMPVAFGRDAAGRTWALAHGERIARDLRGTGRISAPMEDLRSKAHDLAATELDKLGLTLAELKMRVRTPDPRQARVQVQVKARKAMLSATVRVDVSARVDEAMVVHVGEAEISAPNPLVAVAVGALRRRVDRYSNTSIDLNDRMPPGIRLVDVRLDAGTEFVAEASFD